MPTGDLPTPDHVRNMRLLGHSDQGGRADGVQIMVHRGHAYIGHMFSKGFSIVDVTDPRQPRPANYIAAPPGTWNIHLQTHDDLLLVVNAKDMFAEAAFADERAYYRGQVGKIVGTAEGARTTARDWTAGLAVYDIASPAQPRRIGFMPIEGGGIHRIWYTGGRWAYVSALIDGFTDYIFLTSTWRIRRTRAKPGVIGSRACTRPPANARIGPRRDATDCTTPSSTATLRMARGATPAW